MIMSRNLVKTWCRKGEVRKSRQGLINYPAAFPSGTAPQKFVTKTEKRHTVWAKQCKCSRRMGCVTW